MTPSPKRILEDGAPFDRSLLRAARAERPDAEYERRVLAAVLVAPAAGLARPSLATRLLRSKIVGLAIVAVGAGVAAYASPGSRTGAPATAPTSAAIAHAPVRAADVLPPAAEPVTTTPDQLPSAPPPALAPGPGPGPRARPPAPAVASAPVPAEAPSASVTGAATSSLPRELALLDEVKRRLRAGETAEAEAALDRYDAEHGRGVLAPEAGLLRIRVLLARGERARATALADEMLAREPDGVHAPRIRALVAPSPSSSSPAH